MTLSLVSCLFQTISFLFKSPQTYLSPAATSQTASAIISYFTKNIEAVYHQPLLSQPCIYLQPFPSFYFLRKGHFFQGPLFLSLLGPGTFKFLPPLQVPFKLQSGLNLSNIMTPLFPVISLFLPLISFHLIQSFWKSGIFWKCPCLHLSFLVQLMPGLQFPLLCGNRFC